MKLLRLSLQGYKSFAARTEFVFDGGITAIVGPNGSGKSNIADAVRWVLGEQSYSLLRSRRTTDLIFSGSDGRSRVGMAEATVVLDNCDGSLPIDYQEVAISRRAYRSGENEYHLNGSRVRLRDIAELLAEGGLNRLTYAVISQGMVDAALSWSPLERRRLFEEAAGITIYQSKREEALRRLEETGANVLRVHDIMAELEPQLRYLAGQAEQATRLAELQKELRALQERYYDGLMRKSLAERQSSSDRATYLQHRLRQQLQELEAFEQAVSLLAQQNREKMAQIESWQREGERLRGALASAERQLAVLAERERATEQRLDEMQQELKRLAEEEVESKREEATAIQEFTTLSQAQQTLVDEVAALEVVEACQRQSWLESERRLRDLRRELAEVQARATQARAQRQTAEQRRQELVGLLAEAEAHAEALRQAQVERANALEAAAERRRQAQRSQQECQQQVEDMRLAFRQRQQLFLQTRQQLAAAEEEEQRLHTRLNMLARVQQESYYPGVRSVLELADQEGEASGILGPVSSLLQVPAHLEVAIEASLGSRLQQVVVRRWQDAERAIAYLKEKRSGRVTFLPLETIRPPAPLKLPSVTGVVGLAADMLTIAPGLEVVLQFLLNRLIIVQDLHVARILLDHLSGSYTIATLAGEVAQSSGSVTGGGERQAKSAILERERERRSLPMQITAARQRRQALALEAQKWQEELRLVERTSAQVEEQAQQAQATAEQVQRQEWRLRLELQQAEDRLQLQQERRQAFLREDESLAQTIASAEQLAAMSEEQMQTLQAQIQALEGQLLARRDESERQLHERRLQLATLQERLTHLHGVQTSARQRLGRLQARQCEREEQQCALRESLAEVRRQHQEAKQAVHEYRQALRQLQESIEPAQAELGQLGRRLSALQQEERCRRQWYLQFSQLCYESERAAERAQDAMRALAAEIERELGPESAKSVRLRPNTLENEPLSELKERIEALRRRCQHIGLVNPNAPQEHAAALERYNFLASQAEDLEKAAASLRRVIGELEHTMHERFTATFDDVARRFGHYFQVLFTGGNAHLRFTEADDLASAGVEIVVRPPGKRGHDLAALSGGERALTSCALLFALLEVSNTPFCVLDEVDAMLDEANVGRFCRVMQGLAEKTQFILISHNRATIESASIIYGVTMGEDGTSRVLSLKLNGNRLT